MLIDDMFNALEKIFPKGTDKDHTKKLGYLKNILSNLPPNKHAILMNKIVEKYGVKKALKIFSNRNKLDPVVKKVLDLTNNTATIGTIPKVIGKGVAGTVLECISYSRCPLKWRRAILKFSKANDEFENEVKYLKKITKYMEENPKQDPIAPKYYGHFVVGEHGYILMQNIDYVFPKAKRVTQWRNFSPSIKERFSKLDSLKTALNKLHGIGVGHGNMHSDNVWVVELPGKKFKFIFSDFGRSYNYKINKLTPINNRWKYSNMVAPIKLAKKKNLTALIMNNNKVFKSYTLRKKKLNSNKK